MQNLENVYIETNQVLDDRKSDALNKRIADLQCIDNEMRIIVQRVEKDQVRRGASGQQSSGNSNPDVIRKLTGAKNQSLKEEVSKLISQANNDINFSNFDKCYQHVCQAIATLERSA